MTAAYLTLYLKAHEFANFAGYTLIATSNGHFEFFNCPVFRSFGFDVDPYAYDDCAPEVKIMDEFKQR